MHLPQHVAWYLVCFFIGAALGLIPIWIVEVLENTNDSPAATIVAIGREMNWAVVLSGAFSFAGVEGFTMLAEIFLKRREAKGREEGRSEGRVEGLREGRSEGRVEGLREGRSEGRVEGLREGRSEERQQMVSRFDGMTPEERLAEIERLIAEARDEGQGRNGSG